MFNLSIYKPLGGLSFSVDVKTYLNVPELKEAMLMFVGVSVKD